MIKGWQKLSLIDYDVYVASVLFLGGCNFRCDYCHNPDFVLNFDSIPDIEFIKTLEYLKKRKKWIDGVCITGGEPTIHKELIELVSKLKQLSFKVKIDTNGSNPEMIEHLIKNKLVDYIAMDIKNSLDKYDKIVCVTVDKEKIKKTIEILKNSEIDYEFRTTVIPTFVTKEDIINIAKLLKGSKKFVIQNFDPTKPLINNELRKLKQYTKQELNEMVETINPYFEKVEIRA